MNRIRRNFPGLAPAVLCLLVAVAGSAQTPARFYPTNLVVVRVGDGLEPLSDTGNSAFLDQFTTSGALVSSFSIPDKGPTGVVLTGADYVEGYLTRSLDGRLLCLAAYGTPYGGALDITTATAAAVPRVVATFNGLSQYSQAIVTTTDYSATAWRCAATDGSNNFWGAGLAGGTIYLGGSAARAVVQSTKVNCRVVQAFNGSLYMSSASALGDNLRGIYKFTGLPKVATTLPAPTIFTNTFTSPNGVGDFAVSPFGTVIYFADDRTINGVEGGIQRWDFNLVQSVWVNTYNLTNGLGTNGTSHLEVDWSGSSPVLYVTTPELVQNRLLKVIDTGAASSFALLATAGSNQLFRGVKFGPITDPPAIVTQPAARTNGAGTTATFTVGATGTAPLSYQWQLASNNLTPDPRITGAQSNVLTIADVTNSDAGYYRVIITSGAGSVTSTNASLSVFPTKAIVWSGAIDGNWDTSTFNWMQQSVATNYAQVDFVTFDDSLTGTTNVTLSTALTPGGMIFNNSASNYFLSGVGKLSGATGLTKNGSGRLTLAESGGDNFSGGIALNGGALVLDDTNSSMSGGLAIAAGTALQAGNNDGSGNLPAGNVTLNGTLFFNRTNNATVSNVIGGSGALIQSNSNVLTVSADNSGFTGSVAIAIGTLRVGHANALGFDTNVLISVASGATLDLDGTAGTNKATVAGSGVGGNGAVVNNGAAGSGAPFLAFLTLAGDTTIGGTGRWDLRSPTTATFAAVKTGGQPYNLTKVGSAFISIANATIDAALSNITVQVGTLEWNGVNTSAGNPNGTLTIFTNAGLQLWLLTTPFNKKIVINPGGSILNGNGSNIIAGAVTLGTGGNSTFSAGGSSLTVNGRISGSGNLAKTGATLLVLNNSELYTGSTLVNAGTLALSSTASISDSALISVAFGANLDATAHSGATLTLASGQTLQGNGTVAGQVVAGSGSTVAAGPNGNSIGALNISQNLNLQGATFLKLNAASATNDQIRAASVTYGGSLILTNLSGSLKSGAVYKLFNASTYAGSFGSIAPAVASTNLLWDTNFLVSDGLVGIVATNGLVIYRQPQPFSPRFVGGSVTLAIAAGSPAPISFQWLAGTNAIPGATNANLTLSNLQPADAGVYACAISNAFGTLTSSNALVTVSSPSSYVQAVMADNPVAYWRLDEGSGSPAAATNGEIAFSQVGNHNGIYTTNVLVGAPGYSANDSDTAASFGSLVKSNSNVGSVPGIDFAASGASQDFSVEAWVHASPLSTDNGIVSVGYGSGGEQFELDVSGNGTGPWRFFVHGANGVLYLATSTKKPDGNWHHLVGVCDHLHGAVELFVDGVLDASAPLSFGAGLLPASSPLSIGARRSTINSTSLDLQFVGTIDEVALYGTALNSSQVFSHYAAGAGGQPQPVFLTQPQSQSVNAGATVLLSATAKSSLPLGLQWLFDGTALPSATNATLVLTNVQTANAGFYQLFVSNTAASATSSAASVAVTSPLTNSSGAIAAPFGMVDWWPGEGNAADLVGFYNGSVSGGLSYVTGQVGSAFNFDGATAHIVTGAPRLPAPWTASFWVKRQTGLSTSTALMGDSVASLKLEQYNGTRQVGPSVFGAGDYTFGYTAPLGVWVHLVFVGTTTNTSLYTNGVFQSSLAVTMPLGRAFIGNDLSGIEDPLSGSLDEIAVFNRALTSSEIQVLFNAGVGDQFVNPFPPTIIAQPTNQVVALGADASFVVAAASALPLTFQWQTNGANLAGSADSGFLLLTNVQPPSAGFYDVVVSNQNGATTSSGASLSITGVQPSFTAGNSLQFGNGGFQALLGDLTGQGQIVVSASTNLATWIPIFTNPPAFGEIQFFDSSSSNFQSRFYRATTVPPP